MPSLLPAVAASLEAARRTVDAAAAAARSGQAAPSSLVDDAREEVNRARTQLDGATAAFNRANQQVSLALLMYQLSVGTYKCCSTCHALR